VTLTANPDLDSLHKAGRRAKLTSMSGQCTVQPPERAQRAADGRNRKVDCVSLSEHFLEPLKNGRHRLRREATEPAKEPLGIDGPELIQCDEARSTPKATRHAPGIGPPARRHRRDDHRAQVLV